MSEDSRLGLVRRVANALLGLESLSDGKIAKIDPNRVHGGESGGMSLLRDKSPFDFHAGELADWCDRAEARADSERRHQPQPMTKLEEDYWFLEEWEGKDYRTVAHRTGMEADDVWRKRERAGVDPQNGRPIEKAA
jgi:hypothetical protein